MLTVISSLLGFLSPFLTNVLDLFKSAQSHKQNIELMKLQIDAAAQGHQFNMEKMLAEADMVKTKAVYEHDSAISSGASLWVTNLRGSVRPIVTYTFFFLFIFIEATVLIHAMQQGKDLLQGLSLIWNQDTQSMFALIISFWFGSRIVERQQFNSALTFKNQSTSDNGIKKIKLD